MTADLPAFLLEQYEEAEHAARQDAWAVTPDGAFADTPDGRLLKGMSSLIRRRSDEALADIAAKRKIVEEHEMVGSDLYPEEGALWCATCTPQRMGPCQTLRLLALPFASHPDYRDEWRPAD